MSYPRSQNTNTINSRIRTNRHIIIIVVLLGMITLGALIDATVWQRKYHKLIKANEVYWSEGTNNGVWFENPWILSSNTTWYVINGVNNYKDHTRIRFIGTNTGGT